MLLSKSVDSVADSFRDTTDDELIESAKQGFFEIG
jgi:hypothetical protein